MVKSKIYNLNDNEANDDPKREPLTFADLEVGDVFRFAARHDNYPDSVSGIRWKVSCDKYAVLTVTATSATAMGTAMETAMAAAMVVRYDLGLKLSNPQRYKQ